LTYQTNVGIEVFGGVGELTFNESETTWPILKETIDEETMEIHILEDPGMGPYLPIWQSSPLITTYLNVNFLSLDIANSHVENEPLLAYETDRAVTTAFKKLNPGGYNDQPVTSTNYYAGFLSTQAGRDVDYEGDPISDLFLPIAQSFEDNTTVALIIGVLHWASYFNDLLPVNTRDITVVLDDSCTGPSTLLIRGNKTLFVGKGDRHEKEFAEFLATSSWESLDVIQDGTESGLPYLSSHCPPSIKIYPTTDYSKQFITMQPLYMTLTVAMVFVFAILVFIAYDRLVERRQKLVLTKALQSTAIVSSLFPQNIAERLMKQQNTQDQNNWTTSNNNQRLRSFVVHGEKSMDITEAPIADLFPNATVYFADIAGFTAWSSSREPAQVFILLQNLYQAFDYIANRRKVFKVETIGDCYVAVTGCPEIQDQHAVIMARFATDCQNKMGDIINKLCVTLGPDTSGT
jgi:Adenylate and Guanylate cyclase catalytic domain